MKLKITFTAFDQTYTAKGKTLFAALAALEKKAGIDLCSDGVFMGEFDWAVKTLNSGIGAVYKRREFSDMENNFNLARLE